MVRKATFKSVSARDISRHRYKRTSIGNSKNSFGSGKNKRNDRKKYRGQG
jgi:hypothetical protein|tara:strand:+ start:518 stop:667 length:150 start_codon:yes stop_codon:yes gene_type:complete